ncbi:MAG TPA: EcsC family protein [Myxococcaceae bacterium]
MGLLDSERLAFLKKLRPASVKRLASLRMEDVVGLEAKRARVRVKALRVRYPSAGPRELGQHVIDSTKGLASLSGSVSGVFGLASVPADLVVMAWLQIRMLDDIATAYGVDLRFRRARTELLDVLGEANGVGPLKRSGPKLLGKVAAVVAEKGGFTSIGRAMPLVAAPVTAWLNNHHIQVVGEAALRQYDGFARAAAKTRAASGVSP